MGNPEFGILSGSVDYGSLMRPIHMDLFSTFGHEGHSDVHSSFCIAYQSTLPDRYIILKMDLQALQKESSSGDQAGNDKQLKEGGINHIMHEFTCYDGID